MTGRIRRLHDSFGFIRSDGLDFFFHNSDVVGGLDFDQLDEGDLVAFEAVTPQPEKGPRAQQVAWQEGKRADG
jgi:'Cold-shock' DNA-binding domain